MAAEHRTDKPLRILLGIAVGAIRRELTSQLDDHGYDVVAALDDTTRILQIAAFVRPDLTLLDANLSTIGGIALAGALRERSIAPSVVLLDQATPQVVREAAHAGVAQAILLAQPLPAAS